MSACWLRALVMSPGMLWRDISCRFIIIIMCEPCKMAELTWAQVAIIRHGSH